MSISKVQTGLRLDEITYSKLKTLSKQENRSLNNLVEYVIQRYIDDYEKANGSISLDSAQEF